MKEYQHGYAVSRELETVLKGYKEKALMRNELRVFAALLEKGAQPARSRVDVAHIINKKTGIKGVRRLTPGEIDKARARLRDYLEQRSCERSRPKAVSRRALRHIAQGRCTKVEAVFLLMYSMRRITQSTRKERLQEGERYARFKLEHLHKLAGVPKANGSRALAKLRAKGFIGTIEVSQRNEFAHGLLYIDGHLISLVRSRQAPVREARRGKESTTAKRDSDNSPPNETTTISKKGYLKRDKKEIQMMELPKTSGRSRDHDFERILKRAVQMKEEWMEQAA